MKTLKTATLAAFIAVVLILGVWQLFPGLAPGGKAIKIEHLSGTPVSSAVFALDEDGNPIPMSFTETAEKVLDGVVHIKSSYVRQRGPQRGAPESPFFEDDLFERFFGPRFRFEDQQPRQPQPRVSTGSGVIISPEGYIVTNNHVIDNADDVEVSLNDNRVFKAKVIGTDPATDLAVIKIEADNLTTLPFANSDEVRVGEWVLAVGNPFSLTSTVTAGIVSAKGRNINILREQYAVENFIQTDAAINPGNSGGALVNLQGGLVGINTAIASPTGAYSGYGFAVPSNMAAKVVEDILKYGSVQRAVLGITIRSLDGNLAREKGITLTQGVYVDSLMENSAALKAGIEKGDVIVAINERPVRSAAELQGEIAQFRPGDKVKVKVNRKGKEKNIEVALSSREGEQRIVKREAAEIGKALGAEFEELDAATAAKLEIEGGVRVKRLHAGKLRRETQMQEGFIITKVDNQAVKSIRDLERALLGKQGGVLIEGRYENQPGSRFYAFGME
jgi:Do/DeqQ family serine protease